MKRTLYLFLMLTVLLLTGCRKQSPVADKLQQAEAMMDEHPDSALNLLKGIAQPELQTQAHHARYALLYSQALDKNYIDLTNDSLISIAVDYYRHTDDVRRKFLSYYYKGRIHENAKDYPQAMIAYMEAEQLVDELGDDYYAGLLCQNMSFIYQYYYDFPKALEYAQRAYSYFERADKPIHCIWKKLSIASIHRNMNNDEEAIQVLEKAFAKAEKLSNHQMMGSCLGNLIITCVNEEQWEDARKYYDRFLQYADPASKTPVFIGTIATLYAHEGDFKQAQTFLDAAWKKADDRQDSILLYHKSYLIHEKKGNYRQANEDLARCTTLQNKQVRVNLQQPILTTQMDFLRQELEWQKYKAQSERQIRTIGIVLTIILAVAAVYGVSVYIKRQREKYLKQIRKQVPRIELLKDEKNDMEEEVRKLNQLLSQGGELKDELMQAKGEWTRLEDIHALELYTRLRQDPGFYNPSADYEALLRWVDIASARFAERLQESYPRLNVSEITLCCLARMGYSSSQMAEVLHVKTPTVNRYIYRICTSLELPNHKESFRQFIVAF